MVNWNTVLVVSLNINDDFCHTNNGGEIMAKDVKCTVESCKYNINGQKLCSLEQIVVMGVVMQVVLWLIIVIVNMQKMLLKQLVTHLN